MAQLAIKDSVIARRHHEAAGDGLHDYSLSAWLGHAIEEEHTDVGLCRKDGERLPFRTRRNHDLNEYFCNFLCGRSIERTVQCDDAAKCRERVTLVCLCVRVENIFAERNAARIHMFDDDRCRPLELSDALERRVGVIDVVVAQFLALHLTRAGYAGARIERVHIESRLLVGIFSVPKRLTGNHRKDEPLRPPFGWFDAPRNARETCRKRAKELCKHAHVSLATVLLKTPFRVPLQC